MTPTHKSEHDAAGDGARRPAGDDRRGDVHPHDSPVPSSPAPDDDAVRKGEENLDRIVPK